MCNERGFNENLEQRGVHRRAISCNLEKCTTDSFQAGASLGGLILNGMSGARVHVLCLGCLIWNGHSSRIETVLPAGMVTGGSRQEWIGWRNVGMLLF